MTNDTRTMTLSEFLLARIAEDEESRGYTEESRGQVLAECEAKRRIVIHEYDRASGDDTQIVRILAAVYADHPAKNQARLLMVRCCR
jgi:hypothetical protein